MFSVLNWKYHLLYQANQEVISTRDSNVVPYKIMHYKNYDIDHWDDGPNSILTVRSYWKTERRIHIITLTLIATSWDLGELGCSLSQT